MNVRRKEMTEEPETVHEDGYVSKSQKKRDALALQDLGKRITTLKPEVIRSLPLSPEIQGAMIAAKTMKMGSLKRQIQYIGKLLRQEEDLTELHRTLADYFK